MQMTMGNIIKELRKERGLTQEELAERLGVTYQAISKWENNAGMPDISQVVPLASVFGVSTDVLFGIAGTTETEEALRIIANADSVKVYGRLSTYLDAYDILMKGLKKYPSNLTIISNCMSLGLSLSMPENEWLYAEERSHKIMSETIRQANFIIANSKNITDILTARQTLIFLYSVNHKYDLAIEEARRFPVRTDFTLYSNMARVNEYSGNYERVISFLCSDIDYSLQAFEDNVARLGKAYHSCGRYNDAIEVYETFFAVMKAIFREECPLPYHDFDSGDCYLLLAEAYLAVNQKDRAMDSVEELVMYYINLFERYLEDEISRQSMIKSPLLKETEVDVTICKKRVAAKLLEKLADENLQTLNNEARFIHLKELVQSAFA